MTFYEQLAKEKNKELLIEKNYFSSTSVKIEENIDSNKRNGRRIEK